MFIGQVGTYARLPYIEGVFLLIGLVVVFVAPGLSGRVRAGLATGQHPIREPEPVVATEVSQ